MKRARAKLRLTDPTKTNPEIQAEARKAGPDAIRALHAIVKSKISTDIARISAAQTLLDRGYGRPTQTNINAAVNSDGAKSEITETELNNRVAKTLERIEGLTKRKREKIKDEERPADVRKLH